MKNVVLIIMLMMGLMACKKNDLVEPSKPNSPIQTPIVYNPLSIKDGDKLTVTRPYSVYNNYTISINIFDSIITPYVDSIYNVNMYSNEITNLLCYLPSTHILYNMSQLDTTIFYIHKGAEIFVMSQTQDGETVGGIILNVNNIPKFQATSTTFQIPKPNGYTGPPEYKTSYQGYYIYN